MKTTLSISDATMRAVKREAARRGQTMSELVESALRQAVGRTKPVAKMPPLGLWRPRKPARVRSEAAFHALGEVHRIVRGLRKSVDFIAHASCRVTGNAVAMGEAPGATDAVFWCRLRSAETTVPMRRLR